MARRDMGKLVSSTSSTARPHPADRAPEVDLDLGDIVGVTGRPSASRARGEPRCGRRWSSWRRTAARCRTPSTGSPDVETRYRKRYLDLLVNEEARRGFLRASDGRRDPALPRRGRVRRGRDAGRCSRATAAPSPSRSSRTTTTSTRTSTCGSPTELYLKRLIVGGLEKVYEIGKDFRNEGISYKHSTEFTQLEWYEAYADYRDTMERIERLVETVALEVTGDGEVTFRGHELDLKGPWRRPLRRCARGARPLDPRRGRAARGLKARGSTRRPTGLGAARRPRASASTSSRR